MSKFSNVVKNEVVKKTVYDKFVPKVNNIDTSRFVLKTKFDSDKTKEKKFLVLVILLKNKIIMLKLVN